MSKKIAIVGKAPSSRGLAPYGDESWEIWTLADLVPCKQAPRWDRHFEVHPWTWFTQRGDAYWPWLKTIRDKPIMAFWEHPELPSIELIPWRKITEKYGRYLTNTVSWQIAMAIEEEPDEIGIWGVDMAQDTEYAHQRPSCEWLIGWAMGAGINVTVAAESDLMKCSNLYGLETDSGQRLTKWQAKRDEFARRRSQAQDLAHEKQGEATFFEGCEQTWKYAKQFIADDAPTHQWEEQTDYKHMAEFLLNNPTGQEVFRQVTDAQTKTDNGGTEHESSD